MYQHLAHYAMTLISGSPIIKFVRVHKSFPSSKVLYEDLNCHIYRGEFIYLTGVSGSGKTTLFKMLLGLEKPDSGEVVFQGRVVHKLPNQDLPSHRRGFGVIFQDYKLLPYKTARENIITPLLIQGLGKKRIQELLEELAAELKLSRNLLDSLAGNLSGGEQQLAAIARAAIHKPPLILADEPTANLDIETSGRIFAVLEQLNQKGITILLSTHDLEMVRQNPHKSLLLKDGRLFEVDHKKRGL